MTIEDLQAVLMNMSQTELSELAKHLYWVFEDPRGADKHYGNDQEECRHCGKEECHGSDCDFNNARLMLGWEE